MGTPRSVFKSLPIDTLYARGFVYMQENKYDEATLCFHYCSEKSLKSNDNTDLRTAAKAQRMKAQILFYKFFDFDRASEILASAKQICEHNHFYDIMPSILLEEAGFYTTYAIQNPSKENFSIGEKSYQKAFDLAIKQKDFRTMASAFSNMVNRFYGEHRYKEMQKLLNKFGKQYHPNDTNSNIIFANALYRGFSKVVKNDNISARKCFKEALTRKRLNPRYRFELNVAIVRTFIAENKIDSAVKYELQLLDLSRAHQLKDGEAVALTDLGALYNALGDTAKAQFYIYQSMQKKDSLINVRRLDKVHNMKFLQDLYKLEAEARKNKQTSTNLIIAILLLGLLAVSGICVTYYRHQKRKKNAVAEASSKIPAPSERKYQNSTLNDYTKEVIAKRIAKIIEKPDEEIFNPNFSIDTLASMCKTNTHYISQIINDIYSVNFSTLINQVRIREACRRIRDNVQYGKHTLESIGYSVGYANRVSFSNAFKKNTGMTPGQYRDSVSD